MTEVLELSRFTARNKGEREMTWREQIRDREAFTGRYQAHHPSVFRFVCSITGDRWAAAEITQDVFVWLLRHPDRFDPLRGELTPFLLGVARKFLLRRGRTFRNLVPLDERSSSSAI